MTDILRTQQFVDPRNEAGLMRRLHDVVLGSLPQTPGLVGFHALRAHDQHGDRTRRGVLGQRARGLEPVHAGQDHVHEDEVGQLALADGDAVLGARRCKDLVAIAFEQLGQDRRVGRRILDQQNSSHGVALPPGQALTCLRIASSSSSRVNGLVRYCSEPTMRPRALSNRPSFEDSMITGVDLNIWLFLISAQVWYPSRRGIMMSTKMICGCWSA